ncbi:MAG: hypothetical protein JWN68_1209 [Nocardioides sp.]|jgi:serine/threonine-protein kinase HipA|uniref:type II toxin-antitoxin system HipA family toxin n=1 Tax=Nocardioides sp. TaxID=35761 RepID=UPI0026273141|nr:HipA domain-containing protein [Nocardioides sp.]MCW2833256.1 hypothetical protein [Nocardioides sp.]
MTDEIEVAVDLGDRTMVAGTARFDRRRNQTTTSFDYDSAYLADPASYPIDPALSFDTRGGVVSGLPGAFADCAPDRWGQMLISKRIRASETGTARSISELDYLLGVSDTTRQGALRFRRAGSTMFENAEADVPQHIKLPELLHASDQVARDGSEDLTAIKLLLNAGTGSLGGARPKASIIGQDELLYIAKFPRHTDEWDVMAWEKTALDLADRAGIAVPRTILVKVSGRSVLLLERFDRRNGLRVGYMSAMTLIEGSDGGGYDYLDVAAGLVDVSGSADEDLSQMWRRMAFSVAIHNTDDHMRNHGLLREPKGWRLSPAFDVNPNPDDAEERATSIAGETSRQGEVQALMLTAAEFGLSDEEARRTLSDIEQATASWRDVAAGNGIPSGEINRFSGAFDTLRDQFKDGTTPPQTRRSTPPGADRGISSTRSNKGSFKSRQQAEADVDLR